MNERRTIVAVSGGLGQPSSTRLLADTVTASVRRELAAYDIDAQVEVVELREHAHEVTDAMLTGFAPSALRKAVETVEHADGLVVVTPVFSASYSGLFKSFFDVLDNDALDGRPTLIAATGGTARHSLALEHAVRPLFTYLRAFVVPTAVYAATDDWGTSEAALGERIDRAAGQLAGLVAARAPVEVNDPFALTTSFEQLLNR